MAGEELRAIGDEVRRVMAPDELNPDRVLAEVAYGNPAGVDPTDLVSLLDRPDEGARRAGAEALARLASTAPERVEPFVGTIDGRLDDGDPDVRAHLLCALASVAQETPDAVASTGRVLDRLSDGDNRVREWAALAVAYVGVADEDDRPVAVDRLTDLLDDDRATVRRNACLGLGRIDDEAADAVRPLLDDPDETVRETARQVHRIGER